jgi:4-amino-4-deoxy-L-arabinose transferase-like glycosyltransferase
VISAQGGGHGVPPLHVQSTIIFLHTRTDLNQIKQTRTATSSTFWLGAIIVATFLATLIKLYFAYFTAGSADVAGYVDYVANIHQHGVRAYYYNGPFNNTFNNPPFMIHALLALDWLARKTHLAFPFWLRLVSTLADVGTIAVMWRVAAKFMPRRTAALVVLLLALCPIAIVISGFHGSTASEMVFLIVLSIYLLEEKHRVGLAGAAFGLALNVKISPLMLALAIFLYLPAWRARAKFFAAAAAVFLLGSLPYLLMEPRIIAKAVLGYNSIYGNWGWTSLMSRWYPQAVQYVREPFEVTGIHATFATIAKWLMLALIIIASFLMNRLKQRPPLFLQGGFIITIFLVLTPGFGSQYLMWLLPWIVILGLGPAILYYAAGSIYVVVTYACFFAFASPLYCGGEVLFFPMIICWASVIVMLIFYVRAMVYPGAYWKQTNANS